MRKRMHWTVTALVMSAAITSATVALVASPGGASQGGPTGNGATSGLTPQPAAPDADTAIAVGRSSYASTFGGVAVTQSGTHLDVYLTKLDAGAEAAIEHGRPASEFTFIEARASEKETAALRDRIAGDYPTLKAKGIQVISVEPTLTGTVTIRVLGLTPPQAALLSSTYGSSDVTVVAANPSDVPVPTDRNSDSQPWNGGDFVSVGSSGCTSGFPVHSPPNQGNFYFLLLAAHCYSLGSSVVNYGQNGVGGNGNTMCFISQQSQGNGGIDVELCNTPAYGSSNLVFTGPPFGASRAIPSGVLGSAQGIQICQSGAYSGETCGMVVNQFPSMCITLEGRMVCNVYSATSGGVANEGGNSGGPVFRFIGSSLYGVGVINAGSGPVNCAPGMVGGEACYNTIYYTDLGAALSTWNLSLNT